MQWMGRRSNDARQSEGDRRAIVGRGSQGPGLLYRLPATLFKVKASKRATIVRRPAQEESAEVIGLSTLVDVQIERSVVPSGRAAVLNIDLNFLEKVDIRVSLDDRGLIESINSDSSRDVAGVISLVGKMLPLARVFLPGPSWAPAPQDAEIDLGKVWSDRHPDLSRHRSQLVCQVERGLQNLSRPDATAVDIEAWGRALEVLQSQLASIGEARRSWLSDQAGVTDEQQFTLSTEHCVWVTSDALDSTYSMDDAGFQLPQDGPAALLAEKFDVCLALADPGRQVEAVEQPDGQLDDILLVRRARPAELGLYRRTGHRTSFSGDRPPTYEWVLDEESRTYLDLVDERSELDAISLDSSVLRSKRVELAFHSDKSLKTFGFSSASAVSAVAESVGGVVDAVSELAKSRRPSAERQALDKAKAQLDLLKATSDYEQLAATRGRAAELAVLEQERRLSELSVRS